MNPYKTRLFYETEHFTLRVVEMADAPALLKCYGDPQAVRLINADNCTSDFYYRTLPEMEACLKFWIDSYAHEYFARLAIVKKDEGEAVGTIEIFGGEAGVLRVDLRADCETDAYVEELFALAVTRFYEDFDTPRLMTKAIPEAAARRAALQKLGFAEDKNFRPEFSDYWGRDARAVSEKNRKCWNAYAAHYGARYQHAEALARVLAHPESAFHPATWQMIASAVPNLAGARVCVPSSGDNLAVFALARLGARVTSCDISENQLENAARIARENDLDIEFVRADTMGLAGLPDETFDFVYTSNGVHVWIDDLAAMYRGIFRVMKPGAAYILYELHPFHRPFNGNELSRLEVVKPYDMTGPFADGDEVNFAWRVQDILNAILEAGLTLRRLEEMPPVVSYDDPDWIPCDQKIKEGVKQYDKAAVDRLYDWRHNPLAALPHWLGALATKNAT